MSEWQTYIENLMAPDSTGLLLVTKAAICGIEKGKENVWSSSPDFPITAEEIKKLVGDSSTFSQCGVHIGGIKCLLLRNQLEEEGSFCMQLKTVADADGKTHGMCVGKTFKAVVIVKGAPDAGGGQLCSRVFNIVQHLRGSHL
ncbi:profilin-1-like [Brachyistius frenatus]|uniref:profilin-1-like n=1 Tax=Brachyistius frenatus TaxID=100188 RepID=UPI0037E8CA24